jgi:hypothetical protein
MVIIVSMTKMKNDLLVYSLDMFLALLVAEALA